MAAVSPNETSAADESGDRTNFVADTLDDLSASFDVARPAAPNVEPKDRIDLTLADLSTDLDAYSIGSEAIAPVDFSSGSNKPADTVLDFANDLAQPLPGLPSSAPVDELFPDFGAAEAVSSQTPQLTVGDLTAALTSEYQPEFPLAPSPEEEQSAASSPSVDDLFSDFGTTEESPSQPSPPTVADLAAALTGEFELEPEPEPELEPQPTNEAVFQAASPQEADRQDLEAPDDELQPDLALQSDLALDTELTPDDLAADFGLATEDEVMAAVPPPPPELVTSEEPTLGDLATEWQAEPAGPPPPEALPPIAPLEEAQEPAEPMELDASATMEDSSDLENCERSEPASSDTPDPEAFTQSLTLEDLNEILGSTSHPPGLPNEEPGTESDDRLGNLAEPIPDSGDEPDSATELGDRASEDALLATNDPESEPENRDFERSAAFDLFSNLAPELLEDMPSGLDSFEDEGDRPSLYAPDLDSEFESDVPDVIDSELDEILEQFQELAEVEDDSLSMLRLAEEDLDDVLPVLPDPLEEDLSLEAVTPSGRPPSMPDLKRWYLGIDVGTTGISAVLLNRDTCELFPIYWLAINRSNALANRPATSNKTFCLPFEVVRIDAESATARVTLPSMGARQPDADLNTLRGFKPFLRSGVSYYLPSELRWEPVIQWTDTQPLPLSILQQGVRVLLATLACAVPAPAANQDVVERVCGAVGLDERALQAALQQLSAVMVSYPANWSDTYTFNLREALLAARLVAQPEQIYFVEESIATLLSELPSGDGRSITLPAGLSQSPELFGASWRGNTLVINAGATTTELALANVPTQLQQLAHRDILTRSLSYGGQALDQDILCQLIYPAWIRQAHQSHGESAQPQSPESSRSTASAVEPTFANDLGAIADPWRMMRWELLTLPIVGDPDMVNRYRLQRRLLSSDVGTSLLEAARYLKLSLQQQERITLIIGGQTITITRQDLGSRVLLPYIQRLNRELNTLLTQAGSAVLGVNQVICSGGTASLPAIARWLRQKLPNATIIQDTYAPPTHPSDHHLPVCSRVAYGLAAAPLHPHVLDLARHQYSDYFLLMELLRAFPDAPITVPSLMQILERRGIKTQQCQPHILALLEGHLPPGLIPAERDGYLLTLESQQNPDYKALLAAPLFLREGDQTYRPNPQQWAILRRYLDTILSTSHQTLSEALPITLELGVIAEP
ncbi:hypothetical protein ACQ4M4_13250 [Leptolyngbya sp. AN02str]|uniref:hypothetical protein n=1 Tax=Leptolyngbya sp. AN02str TaxID=3423363 RepID=UPI003D31457F